MNRAMRGFVTPAMNRQDGPNSMTSTGDGAIVRFVTASLSAKFGLPF